MREFSLVWALSVLFSAGAGAEEPVHFPDPLLKAAVERDLWIPDPTPTDMLELVELHCVGELEQTEVITDLTGLEYALNLRSLNLRMNAIEDISVLSGMADLEALNLSANGIHDLTPLSGLSHLRVANLHENQITDLAPLSGLTQLESLIVRFNNISDLAVLPNLTNLRELDLGENKLGDLSPLSALTQLSTLELWTNRISDVSALAGLTNLRKLNIHTNQIGDLAPLAGLVNLQDVDLEQNRISDLSPLSAWKSLTRLNLCGNPLNQEAYEVYLPLIAAQNPYASITYDSQAEQRLSISSTPGGTVVSPGVGEFTFPHGATVRLEAHAYMGFVFVGWFGSSTSDQNPRVITMDQDIQLRASFLSLLDTLHVDDDAPGDPGPGDPTISDPREDGTPEHPLDSIQEAVQIAGEDVSVFIHPGTYRENIDCRDKSIRLLGTGPNGVGEPPYPVLEAAAPGPAVQFHGANAASSLTALVITGGRDRTAGAILCRNTALSLTHCLIVGNRTTDPNGAALYAIDSDIAATNCTMADNSGGPESAALTLLHSNLTMTNSILWDDTPVEVLTLGTNQPDIRYCAVRGWWADIGNIHADPLFARRGNWIDPQNPETILGPPDVRAVWAAGDYHLQSQAGRWNPDTQAWVRDDLTSPCIDHGNKGAPIGNEPAPHGGVINLGAYGGTGEASKSP